MVLPFVNFAVLFVVDVEPIFLLVLPYTEQ